MILENIDRVVGTESRYFVRLYTTFGKLRKVEVDTTMDQVAVKTRTSGEGKSIIWPVLYEKAMVKALSGLHGAVEFGEIVPSDKLFKHGYEKVAGGGYAGFGMQMITGLPMQIHNIISTDKRAFSNLVTFLMDHRDYPLALASSATASGPCMLARHIHPVGEVNVMKAELSILCDEHEERYAWLPFTQVIQKMVQVVSLDAPPIITSQMNSPNVQPVSIFKDFTILKSYPVTSHYTIPDNAYDAASVAMRLSQSLPLPNIYARGFGYDVELFAPLNFEDEWEQKTGDDKTTVFVSVDSLVQYDHNSNSGRYLVIRKAMEKALELLVPRIEVITEHQKFSRYLMMLGNVPRAIRSRLQTVVFLRNANSKFCPSWHSNSWIEVQEEKTAAGDSRLRCGGNYLEVSQYWMAKYFLTLDRDYRIPEPIE